MPQKRTDEWITKFVQTLERNLARSVPNHSTLKSGNRDALVSMCESRNLPTDGTRAVLADCLLAWVMTFLFLETSSYAQLLDIY